MIPHISPLFLIAAASIYTDWKRVIIEYVDNSIDAAEEFYDKHSNSYTKDINIILEFMGKSLNEFYVRIEDNCTGIIDLERVFKSIGKSNKKDIPQMNGEFGFGMYSFISICKILSIKTSTIESEVRQLELNREEFANAE